MSLLRNIAVAGIFAALPYLSLADSNGNPCIENWKPVALIDKPVANVVAQGGPFQIAPGEELSIQFNYTIVDGERIERELTLCRGEQLRDAVLEGSFDGSQRIIETSRNVSFVAPATASASYVVRIPAPGLFVYYQEANGTPQQYWYNPGVSVPVSVVVGGIMPQTDELDFLFTDKTDSDNDGLVDAWEMYYFADLSQGPSGDFDSDGINNLQEANIGFNPNVADQFAAPIISVASDGSDQWQTMIAQIDANGQVVTKEYEGIQIVRIANPNALGEIRYTIDGSAPGATSLACVSGDGINLGSLGDVEVKAAIMLNGAVVSSSTKLIKQKFTPQTRIPAPSEVWKADVFADYGFTLNYTVQGVLTYWKGAYTPYLEDIYKSFVPNATIIYPGVNAIQMGDEVPGGDVMLTSRTSLGTGWICIDFSKNNSLVFFTLLSRVTWEDGKLGEPTATALAYLYYSPKRFALLHPHAYACWRPAPYGFASFLAENTDTDGDGIRDAYEYFVYSTKHNSGDSDGDGLGDLFEAQRAYLNPNSNVDASADWDNDGKTFLEEKIAGTNPFHNDLDNDGDGLPDALEIAQYGTNPSSSDTDNDGIPDAFEISIESNPLVARQERVSAKFQSAVNAGWHDSDLDWIPDSYERQFAFLDPQYAEDAVVDYDADGANNLLEYKLGTDPSVSDNFDLNDSDSDGLLDMEEFLIGTDIYHPDTNQNGMLDGVEYNLGGEPSVSGPAPQMPASPDNGDPINIVGDSPPQLPPSAPQRPDPAPDLPDAVHNIFIRSSSSSHVKYGFQSYKVTMPAKRYLQEISTQHMYGGCPEGGPYNINGSKTSNIDPATGTLTQDGDEYVAAGDGTVLSTVSRMGMEDILSYDDPPNYKADCPAILVRSSRLRSENTTQMLKEATMARLVPYESSSFVVGVPDSYSNLSADELGFSYGRTQFKFAWPEDMPLENRRSLSYLVLFRPEDDPSTNLVDETKDLKYIKTITWDGANSESPIWELDVNAVSPDRDGTLYLCEVRIALCNSETWLPLPANGSHVIQHDDSVGIQVTIDADFKNINYFFQNFDNVVEVYTSGTCPAGKTLHLDENNSILIAGNGVTKLRVTITRSMLVELGLLPDVNDNVYEISWLDAPAGGTGNFSDSEKFESLTPAAQVRGRSLPNGNLNGDPRYSPLDKTFVVSAGSEIITAKFSLAESRAYQVSNQADVFYYSGHGYHADGVLSLDGGLLVAANEVAWRGDLDVAIIAGCSVLDINNYNGNDFESGSGSESPGELWNSFGPQYLLGYNYSAPSDVGGKPVLILDDYDIRISLFGHVDAWMKANELHNAWNACAIERNTKYKYFRQMKFLGQIIDAEETSVDYENW